MLPQLGKCAYCGRTTYRDDSDEPLSDEHVIAEGMGGTVILPKASCHECQKATTSIEGAILKHCLLTIRHHAGVRMKKRKRENRFSATFVIDGKDVVVDLPIEDYPTMFSLLEFDPPGLLVGRPRDASGVAGVWCVPVNFSDKKLRDSGWDSGVSASIDVTRFGQFLAKIAHCISVSRYGDSFFPIQDVFIRYPTNSTMRKIDLFHTIGGMPASISPSPWLHQVGWATIEANGIGYILISIRFFAYLGAPLYLVVSGQLKTMPKPHELSPFSSAAPGS
jgi:hypothetical protein